MSPKEIRYEPVPDEIIERLVTSKFTMKYSPKLAKRVYVLKKRLSKTKFERHKDLFGYTDIGWTVKYPRHLARVLVIEGVWEPETE